MGDGVPRGTRVMNVDIGGLSPVAAVRTLDRELGRQARQPILLTSGEREVRLDPAQAGLRLDPQATVDEATAPAFNPLAFADMLAGGEDIEPVVDVNPAKLRAALTEAGRKVESDPRNGGVRFADGQAVAVGPRRGQVMDVPGTARAVRAAFLRETVVAAVGRTATPDVTAAEVRRAMRGFAQPAMSGPVTLEVGSGTLELDPTDIDDHLSMRPDKKGKLVPQVRGTGLRATLGSRLRSLENPAKDARIRLVGGQPRVIPSRTGQMVPPEGLAEATLAALTDDSRTARVELQTADADLTTAEAEALGVDEQVSTFTTYYPYAAYRLQNIHRAADLIDGTLLQPGETFSLNDTVGERTAENGFAKGTIIQDGRFFEDYGGGVSQVATTTFNAMFFAGLEDVEHKPHSFYIDRYPEGREATVVWPYVDLRFRNDSGNGILVDTSYTDSSVTVTLWGTERYEIKASKSARFDVKPYDTVYDESKKCLEQYGVKGFAVKVFRHFYSGGNKVRTETFFTRYNPADEIHCGPKPGSKRN